MITGKYGEYRYDDAPDIHDATIRDFFKKITFMYICNHNEKKIFFCLYMMCFIGFRLLVNYI